MPVLQAHAQVNVSSPRISDGVVTWDCVTFGSYAQSDATGGTKEPIKWRVLKVEDGKALLLADKILDCKRYHEWQQCVTWEICTLRMWLNGDFLNAAFTSQEQADILTTTVENPDNPSYGTSGGKATQDKVFLLSIQEAEDGAYGFLTDQARQAANTAYAIEQGASYATSSGNDIWWLRSPGYYTYYAAYVSVDGNVSDYGFGMRCSSIAVRPASWVDLNSPDLTYAGTVSDPSYTVTFDVQEHGIAPSPQIATIGDKIEKPQDPSAEGYEFCGWCKDAECKTAWDFENDIVTSHVTLYAKWTRTADYTVTFDVQGYGTALDQQIVGYGSKVEKPQNPTAEGYLFAGWRKDAECKTAWDFANDTVTSDITLYAKWANVRNPRVADGVVAWDCVTFGSYAQSDATGGTKEPIKWRVLKVEDGKALLLADKNLDCREHHEDYTPVTWETCTLRAWLNGDFLNAAFTSQEQADILTTTVENPDNPSYGTSGGNATQDKVFLLSIQEAEDATYGFTADSMREAANTAYATAQGAETFNDNGFWWLRSPGDDTSSAAYVDWYGHVKVGGHYVGNSYDAVRPASWVDLNSPKLVSAGAVSSEHGTVVVPFDVQGHGTAPNMQCVVIGTRVQKPQDPIAEGYEFGGWYKDAACKTAWNFGTDTVASDTTIYAKWAAIIIPIHRLYNSYSGEHFYTADDAEKDNLVSAGWTYEGIGWNSPATGDPVYHLYNRFGGEHHYTLNTAEHDNFIAAGWEDEGIGWHSDVNKTVPVYREYNPYACSNNHYYTTSLEEHNLLVGVGWKDEGIAWYGV